MPLEERASLSVYGRARVERSPEPEGQPTSVGVFAPGDQCPRPEAGSSAGRQLLAMSSTRSPS